MKSSYLTNLVLLAIVLALLWMSQRDKPDTQNSARLSSVIADEVNLIQIQRPEKPTISLSRQQDNWVITEPFSARANPTRINLLLSLLSAPLHGQFKPMDSSSLGQFGLNQPDVLLTMNNEQFAFGGTEPLNQNRYVLYHDMVYLVQDDVTPILTASAGSFVDNRLIAEGLQLSKLSLPVALDTSGTITLSQTDGQWVSDSSSLSSDSLMALVDSWQHAYAMQVRKIPEEQLATLPEPQISLWLAESPSPMNLIVQQQGQTLRLINPELELEYDFPLASKSQLLPQATTE